MSAVVANRIHQMMADLSLGLRSAGLRRLLVPERVISITEVLLSGNESEISNLMIDVAGEAISLSAGHTPGGVEAIKAIGVAQAAALINIRQSTNLDFHPSRELMARNLLTNYQSEILSWIENGRLMSDLPDSPSDLTMIGREFLVTEELRLASICAFVAASEVMRSFLESLST